MRKSLSVLVLLLSVLLGNSFLAARPSTCKTLRDSKKDCLSGKHDTVNVVCGRRYYSYWVNELVLHEGTEYEATSDDKICVYVKEEAFEMSCNDFLNYRVPFMFCRKQKKEICHDLKQDGFGSVALKWPKKKKIRVPGTKRKVIKKDDGYFKIACKEIGK